MIGHAEPRMLTLLRGSRDVSIDGDVSVDASGPTDFARWAGALSSPVTFAWRSSVTGERNLQVCGRSEQDPVHGRVTVVLDGDRHRDFWDAVLDHEDLSCGDEKPIGLSRLLQLVRTLKDRRRRSIPAA